MNVISDLFISFFNENKSQSAGDEDLFVFLKPEVQKNCQIMTGKISAEQYMNFVIYNCFAL